MQEAKAPNPLTRAREWAPLLALCAVSVTACVLAIDPQILIDEPTIIRPAREYMAGKITTNVLYPSFSFYFYGAFFALTGTLDSFEACVSVARVVNLGLWTANIILFFLLLRRFFDRWWALFGTFLLVATPGFFFSGVMVKTESLQVFEILVALLCVERLRHEPRRLRWHALAGLVAALCVATKLNVLPLSLYAAQLAHLRWLARQPVGIRPVVTAAGAFVATLLLTWTNLWVFDEIVAGWKNDLYFAPGATAFKALPDALGVPYGRYSSFFVSTLPILVGLLGSVLVWPSLVGRLVPPWLLFVAGLGTGVYLALALSVTSLRAAFSFSSALPFLVICMAETVRRGCVLLARSARGRVGASIALLGVAGLSLYNHSTLTDIMYGFFRGPRAVVGQPGPDLAVLVSGAIDHSKASSAQGRIRDYLAERAPERVLLFDSYLLNMCKYTDHPVYQDNCRFLGELRRGATEYVIAKRFEIRYPLKSWMVDPELRALNYYLLRRRGGPAEASEPPARRP